MKIGIVTNMFVLAVVVFFSVTAYAGTYVVPDDYATIQEAIRATWEDGEDGERDIILVRPGVYEENIAFDNSNITIRGIPPVVIRPVIDDDTIYTSTGIGVSLINLTIEVRDGYSGIRTMHGALELPADYTYSDGEEIFIYGCDFRGSDMRPDTAKGIEVDVYEVDPRVVVVKNCSFNLPTAIYSHGGAVVVSGNDVTHGMTKCVGGYYVDCNEDLTISSMIEELLGLME